MNHQLTRYPEGSLRELWAISYPLMISTFAALLMIFTDRTFLSQYSLEALNASVNAGTLAWAFMSGFGMITAMSEVSVAQYNGARKFECIGIPVWQMIWFSFGSLLLLIPLGFFGGALFFQGDPYSEMETSYFRWLMYCTPSYTLLTALSGFFIGRGKTRLITWVAIIANLINIVLDRALIFGVPGWIPEMGIQGAAIATCFGYFFQTIVLVYLFLKKENHYLFGTRNWRLNWQEMKKCLKIGVPQGIFCALEFFGWAVFYWMMTSLSETHITIASICQSFIILLSFFCDGLNRGSAAIAGNLVGAGRQHLIYHVLKSGMLLLSLFTLFLSGFFLFDPVQMVNVFFFHEHPGTEFFALLQDPVWCQSLKICMALSFIYLFFDGARWILGGLLVALGDTLFLLIFGSLSVWIFLLFPVYMLVVQYHLAIEWACGLTVTYAILFFLSYYFRLYQKLQLPWSIINQQDSEEKTPQAPLLQMEEEL